MTRTKKIIYQKTEGLPYVELVEPPQSLLTFVQIPLNFYLSFWLGSVLIYTVNFFRKATFKNTTVIWPDKNPKRLKDLYLPDNTLSYLTEWICFLQAKPREQEKGYVPKGILLVGPPGTGKTSLALAFAREANLPIICETVSYFYSGSRNVWSKIRDIFKLAQKWSPSILFLDDMGTLGSRPSDPVTVTQKGVLTPVMFKTRSQSQKNGRTLKEFSQKEMGLLTHFLIELDGLRKRKNVIVIGATQSIENMDKALLRPGRFERVLWLKPLNQKQRISLLEHNFDKIGHTLERNDWNSLGPLTLGLTGASLQSISHKLILQNRGSAKITLTQIKCALNELQEQQLIRKRKPIKTETKEGKGLFLKKWWFEELSNSMANLPETSWNPIYSHEPLGDWYQQAFVEGKNLPIFTNDAEDVADGTTRDT